VSEQASRARQKLLHKRLRDKDQQISDKEAELVQLCGQLDAKDRIVQELSETVNELRQQLTDSQLLVGDELDIASPTQVCIHIITINFL